MFHTETDPTMLCYNFTGTERDLQLYQDFGLYNYTTNGRKPNNSPHVIIEPRREYKPKGWATELRLEFELASEPRRLPGPPITSTARANTTRQPGQYLRLKPIMATASAEQNTPPQPPQCRRGSAKEIKSTQILSAERAVELTQQAKRSTTA